MAQVDLEQLYQRLVRLSAADISVLQAALQHPGSAMATMPGSANDIVWTDMVTMGWMSKQVESVGPIQMLNFKIEQAGVDPISRLLSRYAGYQAHIEKMVAISNDLYDKVIPVIFNSLRTTDIPWNDCMTILAGLISETVRRVFKQELHDEVIDTITRGAVVMMKRQSPNGAAAPEPRT